MGKRISSLLGRTVLLSVATGCGLLLSVAAYADAAGSDPAQADSSRFEAIDAGVDTIDVSHYPEEMQANYEIVKVKCSHCHTLARVINSNYALPDEWKRYIKRMRHKPGSGIKKKEAKKIWKFLVYDSKIRKKDLIKQKTAAADSTASKSKQKK